MKFNNEVLKQIIKEHLTIENEFLIEGIDIDEKNKTVSFNSSHEDNVDTSVLLNPTYTNINGIDVISIFKRKKSDTFSYDGNPLIYALKGLNDWKFKNPSSDVTNLLKQFIRITEKIETKYDTIITIPSKNKLNVDFLHRLNKIIKTDVLITGYLHKLTAEDVYENYIDWKELSSAYGENYQKAKDKLNSYFQLMVDDNDGYFTYKFIKDNKLRKYIKKTMYTNLDKSIEYALYINDKDILILDDTIGSGKTISESCKEIQEMFNPKSITVITLFSKL